MSATGPISQDTLERLSGAIDTSIALRKKTDEEIADMLLEYVWAETILYSPSSLLLEEAIERLKARPPGAPPGGGEAP